MAIAALKVPLAMWYVCRLLEILRDGASVVESILHSPLKTMTLIAFFSVSAYHGMIGVKVIIEDYVSCLALRTGMIIAL